VDDRIARLYPPLKLESRVEPANIHLHRSRKPRKAWHPAADSDDVVARRDQVLADDPAHEATRTGDQDSH
jgi:hypothetical protein